MSRLLLAVTLVGIVGCADGDGSPLSDPKAVEIQEDVLRGQERAREMGERLRSSPSGNEGLGGGIQNWGDGQSPDGLPPATPPEADEPTD